MGEDYQASQVSCHVEAKNLDWTKPVSWQWTEVWINDLFVRR